MTITEFLTARYDEDERFTYNPALMPVSGPGLSDLVKRARADIAAKRAIVALHSYPASACYWSQDSMEVHDPGEACDTLQLLAQPYAQHPDFDPDWRVA